MQQLFNVSERFSKALDEVRGPNRKRHYIKQAQSWISPSSARRVAAKTLGYGGTGLLLGAIGFALFRNRSQIRKMGSNVQQLFQTSRAVPEARKIKLVG